MKDNFTTTIIGSGSAKPRNGNLSSCQLLQYNGKSWLIDCCDGACTEMLRLDISINKIEHIFITHAHGDHCLGLPCLIATMALNGKTTPLTVHAPREVFDILIPVIEAMCGGTAKKMPFAVTYHEVYKSSSAPTEQILSENGLNVYIVPLFHGALETYGYVFAEKPKMRHINMEAVKKYGIPRGAYTWIRDHDWEMEDGTIILNSELTTDPEPSRVYAYISDTYRFKELPDYLKELGTTTLYCEASFKECDKENAIKWQHCTALDAATIAKDSRTVKTLLIGHISARYDNEDESVDEAKILFENTYFAQKDKIFRID